MATRVDIVVDVSGPLFNGTAEHVIREWLNEAKQDVADEGVRMLQAVVMDKTGRATGQYQSEVHTHVVSQYNDVVISDYVIYGPWLEGISERNRTTRFKGYHLWRRTRNELRKRATQIAEDKLREKYAERLGMVP